MQAVLDKTLSSSFGGVRRVYPHEDSKVLGSELLIILVTLDFSF
jgi:hypothetical protein